MPTIKELEALLKSSEEEMLFWRHAHRDADKRVRELEAENAVMRADIAAALRINNPCVHTGFESTVCEICGYPDPRKMITKLKDERDELEANNAKLRAFWDWSREADKMTFEQYHWTKQALRGERIEKAFNAWVSEHSSSINPAQAQMLRLLKAPVMTREEITMRLFSQPPFSLWGGLTRMEQLFGKEQLLEMVDELNALLVA